MPRLENAIERVVKRMLAVYEREQAKYDMEYGPTPDELKDAYEVAVDMEVQGQNGIQAFIEQYGQEAWDNQVDLALRRSRRRQ